MLGMMDGKLGFNKGQFVGLCWVLKLGDDGDGLGRDVIEDLSGWEMNLKVVRSCKGWMKRVWPDKV